MHDDMKPKTSVKVGSDRSFGITFAVVLLIAGLSPWIFRDEPVRIWALGASVVLAIIALGAPRLLSPLNKLWFRFGLLLHRVISPVVMGLIFFGAFMPIGIIIRLLGRDLLHLERDPNSVSYWILRDQSPKSMSQPF